MGVVVILSCIVSAAHSSSHCAPMLAGDPSHGRQSSMNYSNVGPSNGLPFFMSISSMGPFHRVQSFRNRLLQHGSPMGPQALPANLLRHGFLSPQGHRSCQESAPVWPSHRVTESLEHPAAPMWGLPRAAGGYLLHRGPPWAAGGQPASPWSAPRAAGEALLWCLEQLLPLVLH